MINSQNKIIIDTREKKPLWYGKNTTKKKLEVGDYTNKKKIGIIHIERKSPGDLYQSIIQQHDRFRRELIKAKQLKIKLFILVECAKNTFLKKLWNDHSTELQTPTKTLQQIIETIERKYETPIIWCKNRNEMKKIIKMILK